MDLEYRRLLRGKTRLTSPEQPSAPTANTSPDSTQQQTKEDHDDKRRRIDELESTAAEDEVLVPCPETFNSVTRDDEIAVDVPLLEETVEMSGEISQGWITEEAGSQKKPSSQSHLVHDKYGSAKR